MQFIPGWADIEAKLRTAIKTELLECKANGKTRKARRTVGFERTRAHEKAGPVLYILCLVIWSDTETKPTITVQAHSFLAFPLALVRFRQSRQSTINGTFGRFKGYHHATYLATDPSRPELSLKGKNVIVTEGGGTIGSAMVEAFAEAGVRLIGIVGRNQKTSDSTKIKHATQYSHVNIVTATADITDATSIEAAFSQIRDSAKGNIDIFISNTGYQSRPGTITGSEPRDWWTAFEINVKGSFNTLRAFHQAAATATPNGAIIVILTSGAAQTANPAWSAYSASKLVGIRVLRPSKWKTRTFMSSAYSLAFSKAT
ncbi:hypothetical protein LTR96_010023 [Exophiala xenobiotica]|nr:hypothetical protein LTR96_010023 [Exophiala xenobiotica]KAK5333555.1 hypothetical protein LTR98_010255 [Exophiala xenobiotica]KAK5365806.1 hypothetical protein LTS13_008459 [Exophiala xenobiotica]KAK5404963.1 hypothetical protein LTR06_009230 [Exophiala xenobiotica]KAK5408782.1 hypothetical protein LTR90_009400 [Exophiala xenobiotica]